MPLPPLNPTTDPGLATVELAIPEAQGPGGRGHARRPTPHPPTGSHQKTLDRYHCWTYHAGLGTTSQQGFRRGCGTDTALLQFTNAREHAEETGTPLYTSSSDIRRAFDSVLREAKELGWTRLAVCNRGGVGTPGFRCYGEEYPTCRASGYGPGSKR